VGCPIIVVGNSSSGKKKGRKWNTSAAKGKGGKGKEERDGWPPNYRTITFGKTRDAPLVKGGKRKKTGG